MESKGEEGVLRFIEAISSEPSHLGHKELSEVLAPYRKCNYFQNEIC